MKKNALIIAVFILSFAAVSYFYFSKPAAKAQSHESPAEKTEAETEEAEAPQVEITPEKQQFIGVKIADVSVRELRKIIRTVGRVEYDERNMATVNTKVEGWIEKLYVDYEGRYVKEGDPLAEIYSPELIATQEEFLIALRWAKDEGDMVSGDSSDLLEAGRRRLWLWDISDAQIRRLEETEKPLRTLTIYSPVSGYVVEKMALEGMKVMAGEKLFDVADLSTVWVMADIYEYEVPLIRQGQKVRVTLSYLPGREFSSAIDYIYPSLSGETRTLKVRFILPNLRGELKPKMFTNVEVGVDIGRKLSIPDDAVIDTGTRKIVYVYKGEGYFEPREVMLGVSAEGYREVLGGVKAGEKVAAAANFLIDSEAQLKGIVPLSGHKH